MAYDGGATLSRSRWISSNLLHWHDPVPPIPSYTFTICEARLVFDSAHSVMLQADWANVGLGMSIDTIRVLGSRPTPNGKLVERHFEISFFGPDALLTLWSTGYHVKLLEEPIHSSSQSLPLRDD